MSSILTDLEAALEAFMAAEDAYYGYDRSDIVLLARLLDEKMSTRSTLISRLLTGDTIAALIAVARAMHDENNSSGEAARQAYVRGRAALASLVKEADYDHA